MRKEFLILPMLGLLLQSGFLACGVEQKPTSSKREFNIEYPSLNPNDSHDFSTSSDSQSTKSSAKSPFPKIVAETETYIAANKWKASSPQDGEACKLSEGASVTLKRMYYQYDDGFIKVDLKKKIKGCPLSRGYLQYREFKANDSVDLVIRRIQLQSTKADVEPTSNSVNLTQDEAFNQTMKHILKWEGGCSDHPNDPGGRTFKGITTQVARNNGFKGDVCTMPDSQIMEIYRKKYWDLEPKNHPWPLNLAVMNTCVNSGCGKAKEFVKKLPVDKEPQEQAKWYVDQQTSYYKQLAKSSRFKVFLQGWLNRSNHMQKVISNALNSDYGASIALVEFIPEGEWTAKATEDGSNL